MLSVKEDHYQEGRAGRWVLGEQWIFKIRVSLNWGIWKSRVFCILGRK